MIKSTVQIEVRKDNCNHCQQLITLPTKDYLVNCSNCKKVVVFLCHILQANQYDQYDCKKCKVIYDLIKCPKCECYLALKNFRNGFEIDCENCEFQGVLISCPHCVRYLCLPLKTEEGELLNHERQMINCKHCKKNFRYWICKQCHKDVFTQNLDRNEDSEIFRCDNEKCSDNGRFKDSCWPIKQKRAMCKPCGKYESMKKNECSHLFCSKCYERGKVTEKDMCALCRPRSKLQV